MLGRNLAGFRLPSVVVLPSLGSTLPKSAKNLSPLVEKESPRPAVAPTEVVGLELDEPGYGSGEGTGPTRLCTQTLEWFHNTSGEVQVPRGLCTQTLERFHNTSEQAI